VTLSSDDEMTAIQVRGGAHCPGEAARRRGAHVPDRAAPQHHPDQPVAPGRVCGRRGRGGRRRRRVGRGPDAASFWSESAPFYLAR